MEKDYKKDQRRNEYVKQVIDKMDINDNFKPLLVDVMLRRFSEFDFLEQEIYSDMNSLVNNLKKIEVGKMPPNSSKAAGVYFWGDKKITISADYIKRANRPKDFETLYEIFTHEVFHALARDENGNPKISIPNRYTKRSYFSLEEAIVEKAADRCVYGRNSKEEFAPFFHQNNFGYSDITYIADIIESSYGVTEKAFLRHAIQGRKNAVRFLSATVGESENETLDYLDRLELNYSTLHKTLYSENSKRNTKADVIKDSMTAGILVSSWKLSENIERLDINSPNFQFLLENFKYGYNKMGKVIEHASDTFDQSFPGNNIKEWVLRQIQETIKDNSFRINSLLDISRKKDLIPEEDLLKLSEAAKSGKRDFGEEENLYQKYQIRTDTPEFIPLDNEYYKQFRHTDFEVTEWENSQIPEQMQVFKNEYNKKIFSIKFKTVLEKMKKVFKNAKEYIGGNHEETKALGPGNFEEEKKSSSNFGELSPEDMEKFTKGMQEVLSKLENNKKEQETRENISKYNVDERE